MDILSPATRWGRLAPALLFLAAFAFALVGLNPTFYVDDSPETVTACVTLGIPHPPGYPLHTLIGHFLSLLPVGHYPFRVSLLSAILAASVCVFLYGFLSQKLQVPRRLAALFALLWMVGGTTYPAALSAKTGVYQLTALFLLGILWAFFEGRLGLAAFLLGLSFANHWMTMVTFIPGMGWLLYSHWRGKGLERKELTRFVSLALVGLSVYLFLPLRALQNPFLNWGNPSTWHNFIFDFLRSQYLVPEAGGGPRVWVQQWWACLKTVFFEFYGLVLLALWGMARVYSRHKAWAIGLGLLWLGLIFVVGIYLNLPKEEYYLIPDYVIPAHLITLLFSAWGLETTLSLKDPASRLEWERAAAVLLLVLLAVLGTARLSRDRQTGYTYSYDFVLNGFKTLPRNALYFCKGDAIVFPAWYFQWAEHRRADVAVVGVDGLPMEWVRWNLAQFHPGLKVPRTTQRMGLEAVPALAQWIVDKNRDRELYFSYNKIEDGSLPGTQIVPYGLAGKGFPPGEAPNLDEARASYFWEVMRLRHFGDPRVPVNARTYELTGRDYGVFRNSLGVYYEDLGDAAHDQITPRSKAGDLLKVEHYYEKSFEHFLWSQQWEPENAQYAYNLGNAYFHKGQISESVIWYEKATQLNPRYTIAYFNWGVANLQTGMYAKAGQLFEKVLELQPDYGEAKRGLDFLAQKGFYRPTKQ
jgi:hypothetical protein